MYSKAGRPAIAITGRQNPVVLLVEAASLLVLRIPIYGVNNDAKQGVGDRTYHMLRLCLISR